MLKHIFNKEYIYARLSSFRRFWTLRTFTLKQIFKGLRLILKWRINVHSARREYLALKILLKDIMFPAIMAIIVVIGFCIFEYHINTIARLDLIQNNSIGRYLLSPLDPDTYTQLLATIATITAVFIGLYFAAISAIISSIYSSIPNDIRQLLISDQFGNVYVRITSFSTVLALILLAINTEALPLHLAPPFFTVIAIFTVFAFIYLGKRVFLLSDPDFMSQELSQDILKWGQHATCYGWRWHDRSFQNYYYRKANASILTLNAASKVSLKNLELQETAYQKFTNNLIMTIRRYSSLKHYIPSSSKWFRTKYQYQQWYLTGRTELELKSKTDSPLPPKEIPDMNWLEDELLEIIFQALKKYATTKDQRGLVDKLTSLPILFEDMGKYWSIEIGNKWCNKITDELLTQNLKTSRSQTLQTLSIADICSLLPISIELGFIKMIKNLELTNLRQQLKNNQWTKKHAPYKFNMPPSVVETLEEIRNTAMLEQASKFKHKMPDWYITEVVFYKIDWAIFECWQKLIEIIPNWYIKTGQQLVGKKLYEHAASVHLQAIAVAWKLKGHIELLKKTSQTLNQEASQDFNWPRWDWQKEQQRIRKFQNKSALEVAGLIPRLFSPTVNPNLPDYFGNAVHQTGKACFDALINGDDKRFKQLFKPYFVGILAIFDQLRPQLKNWDLTEATAWRAEPLIDLLEISGYSFMLAEFHSKPNMWQTTKSVWDNYMTKNKKQSLKFIELTYYQRRYNYITSPRASLRLDNKSQFNNLLKEMLADNKKHDSSSIKHPSYFIRFIAQFNAQHRLLTHSYGALDVFAVKYLMNLPDATNINFSIPKPIIEMIRKHLSQEND